MILKILAPTVEEKPTPFVGKLSIRQNRWGNWWGYAGRNRVKEIGASEFDADWWLKEQTELQNENL